MEHQAEINRLQALRKFKATREQDRVQSQPSSRNYRTFQPSRPSPELHFYPGGNKVQGELTGQLTQLEENPDLGMMLAHLRSGTEEIN